MSPRLTRVVLVLEGQIDMAFDGPSKASVQIQIPPPPVIKGNLVFTSWKKVLLNAVEVSQREHA